MRYIYVILAGYVIVKVASQLNMQGDKLLCSAEDICGDKITVDRNHWSNDATVKSIYSTMTLNACMLSYVCDGLNWHYNFIC